MANVFVERNLLPRSWLFSACVVSSSRAKVMRKSGGALFPKEKLYKWLTHLLLALENLHSNRIHHRDLKIADENSGDFPDTNNNGMTDTRCESKSEMKAASLVVRLMGLESMPAGSGSKPQKASASETWRNVADKLGARPGGSDKEDMDFEMAETKSSEPGLQRFRAKCALTYPTRYCSPLKDEEDLVVNSLDHHSTDSYLSNSPNSSSSMDKVLAESVDSVDDESLFPDPDRDLSDCETSLSTRRSGRDRVSAKLDDTFII
ncbi:hypothetical protein CQW23_30962 [Capsicum baccatum]|uniref:DUF3741 domain-containing protein n=1 Tax=Capsicum baccatum TaxID=33114 RepID=A0A2G2V908_CAPBA|nr:hypothetical protein CQW23_30962 [Capsicum baccatum]